MSAYGIDGMVDELEVINERVKQEGGTEFYVLDYVSAEEIERRDECQTDTVTRPPWIEAQYQHENTPMAVARLVMDATVYDTLYATIEHNIEALTASIPEMENINKRITLATQLADVLDDSELNEVTKQVREGQEKRDEKISEYKHQLNVLKYVKEQLDKARGG